MSDDELCLILARGKSKGIPKKNLQTVGGIPLIRRSVDAARQSLLADRVFVSTDDPEIAECARAAGANVIARPDSLATDDATSESAVLHGLDELGLADGRVIMVQPTSPFLSGEDLTALALAARTHDSALTVTESHRFIWRGTPEGSLVGINHDHRVRLRRQDITFEEFAENGAAYAMDIAQFRSFKHRFFGRIGHVLMPAIRSLEIDEPADLAFANVIAEFLATNTRP